MFFWDCKEDRTARCDAYSLHQKSEWFIYHSSNMQSVSTLIPQGVDCRLEEPFLNWPSSPPIHQKTKAPTCCPLNCPKIRPGAHCDWIMRMRLNSNCHLFFLVQWRNELVQFSAWANSCTFWLTFLVACRSELAYWNIFHISMDGRSFVERPMKTITVHAVSAFDSME
jgi:hypothetical protein